MDDSDYSDNLSDEVSNDEYNEEDDNWPEVDGGGVEIVNDNMTLTKMKKYHPYKTRDHISLYEYARVVSALSKYINDLDNLEKYLKKDNYVTVINPCELAFQLLEEGVFDAILDRGIERVSYSTLRINPHWKKLLINDFRRHNRTLEEDLINKLLVKSEQ